jgi:hypothetical protein
VRVAFDVDEQSLVAFLTESGNRRRSLKLAMRQSWGLAVILGGLGVAIVRPDPLVGGLLVAVWVALFVTAWYLEWPRRVRAASKATAGMLKSELGPHVVELLPEGVRESGESGHLLRHWSRIDGASLTGEYLFVEVADVGPSIVIPRSAFGSTDEESRFVECIRAKGGAAQQEDEADER